MQIKKHLALNEVETTVILKTSQLPATKILKNSILVYDSVYQSLLNRVAELRKENEQTEEICKKTNLATKIIGTEMNEMKNVLSKCKTGLRNQILNKFKINAKWKFLDTMEMDLIRYMILEANALKDNSAEQFAKEIKFLKVGFLLKYSEFDRILWSRTFGRKVQLGMISIFSKLYTT